MSQSVVEFKPVTQAHVQHVAEHMRQADIDEVIAWSGSSPLYSLQRGVSWSKASATVIIDGEIAAIMGVASFGLLSDEGSPWLLGTDVMTEKKRAVLKESPTVVKLMLSICPELENWVHADNKVSVRWLRWLGFTVEVAEPRGVNGELFHRFHMRVDDV